MTIFKYNFQQRIFTLKATLNIWKQWKVSLKGKITVLNNLALAPIIYVLKINNLIQNFIWDGSTSTMAQKTLIQQMNKGGLKLYQFETKVNAVKLSWVKRLTSKNEST